MLKLVSGTAYFTGWASVSEAIGLVKGHMIQRDEIQLLTYIKLSQPVCYTKDCYCNQTPRRNQHRNLRVCETHQQSFLL